MLCKSFVRGLGRHPFVAGAVLLGAGFAWAQQTINLSTSKQLLAPVPGNPQKVNSLPLVMAVSPDGKWVVTLNGGYGTLESRYDESLSVMSAVTGAIKDYPDDRFGGNADQTFFGGLVFSADGKTLYASVGSTTKPEGGSADALGNGIAVYSFADGVPKWTGFLKLPMVALAAGHKTEEVKTDDGKKAVPFPAGIAVLGEHLLVAENLADDVVLVDAATGDIAKRWDLTGAMTVPATYPLEVVATKDGKRAFVSLWNASEVVELDVEKGTVARRLPLMRPVKDTATGSHPCALLLDEAHEELYVALSNRDVVAAVHVGSAAKPVLSLKGYATTRLPQQSYFGAEPDALALSADGATLYAANMGSDAVAVIDAAAWRAHKGTAEMTARGFVPTELMPMALAVRDGKLYIATGKGKGTGPNGAPQPAVPNDTRRQRRGPSTYGPTIQYGSLAAVAESEIASQLKAMTETVLVSNRMRAAEETLPFAGGKSPIKHVIYIIKENRTYDQVLGDLTVNGQRVGNGDPKLTMYGQAVTPNEHKLVAEFGVLDNFFDSAEVSADGHVWSNAAIGTDALEKSWQANYRGRQRTYDFEGVVANGYPLYQHIADLDEPTSGYIWSNMAAHGRTTYNFGEYVASVFCGKDNFTHPIDPKNGTLLPNDVDCGVNEIKPGEAIPEAWGGGKNLWPWAIPKLHSNVPTKPEFIGHIAEEAPDFNLRIPDVLRAKVFLNHFAGWVKERAAGKDTMPSFVEMRLGNDHTAGTTPGGPTPKASVADNDLALGQMIDAVSHSAYWNDTAFFILEDDSQNGGDHVDSHRSFAIVVSKYAPKAKAGDAAFVDSNFYTTVSVIRTMEALLGVPPMNNNDAFAPLISSLFTGAGDHAPYTVDTSNQENGLIYTANKKDAPGAAASAKLDFSHEDRVDERTLNLILWRDAMGNVPLPAMILRKTTARKDDDD